MSDGNVFVRMVRSLCPGIYGHHMVKAGLLLALFGGSDSSSDALSFGRTSIHVLIIGDPSLGKLNLTNSFIVFQTGYKISTYCMA
ncbi:unnamed protein product [Soboliphyme baturini]|uniref:MCM domain-containing protein n=1 Tax=Soboliphyme baturini TaxID=241478 RepID=A0A183JB93_9BILA|nr:unnamed protein product [Soboliphyme baturini]